MLKHFEKWAQPYNFNLEKVEDTEHLNPFEDRLTFLLYESFLAGSKMLDNIVGTLKAVHVDGFTIQTEDGDMKVRAYTMNIHLEMIELFKTQEEVLLKIENNIVKNIHKVQRVF